MGKDAFLKAYTPVAKEVAEGLRISHKIVLAQAALEGGWGKSLKDNGLMGFKSHGEEGCLDFTTHEIVNGKKVRITDSFRAYDTWRHLSYHLEYDSLVRRWANEAALPRELSSVLNFTHAEPYNTSLPNHHSRCIVG